MKKEKHKAKFYKKSTQQDSVMEFNPHTTRKNLDISIANKIINYLQQEEKF